MNVMFWFFNDGKYVSRDVSMSMACIYGIWQGLSLFSKWINKKDIEGETEERKENRFILVFSNCVWDSLSRERGEGEREDCHNQINFAYSIISTDPNLSTIPSDRICNRIKYIKQFILAHIVYPFGHQSYTHKLISYISSHLDFSLSIYTV